LTGIDPIFGLCKALERDLGGGIRLLEDAILRRENEGYQRAADWCRLDLGEVYLRIIDGKEKLPFPTLLKNLPTLLNVMMTASSRIHTLRIHISIRRGIMWATRK
jgi:hypothetical protein